jgi:hypothetical protein
MKSMAKRQSIVSAFIFRSVFFDCFLLFPKLITFWLSAKLVLSHVGEVPWFGGDASLFGSS